MDRGGEFLGIEGGGTRTVVALGNKEGKIVSQWHFGPGNVRLLKDKELERLFGEISAVVPQPDGIGIGMAGIRGELDRARVERAARQVWPGIPLSITHDLEISLEAAEEISGVAANVLILSGTGSCCYGRNKDGKVAKLGGGGHVLGDLGSGYDIASKGLRTAVYQHDRFGQWGELGRGILRILALNEPDDLIGWAQAADKRSIAQTAPVVFAAAAKGDPVARKILDQAAAQLAEDGLLCAHRLAKKTESISFILAGGVLLHQPKFAKNIEKRLRGAWKRASVRMLSGGGVLGAVRLAVRIAQNGNLKKSGSIGVAKGLYLPTVTGVSPTEQRNPSSINLDKLSVRGAVALMLDAEAEVIPALRAERARIEAAVRLAAAA
ncbi:MAG TPA: BadF/BadG/BcrA/BcrD ATPase family protein, partial [Verrucomicrobiae bacterium]|nr:BadF/BadG/BcrA/BcrD ATPase family protein [Verrucomicrobiae bacterium]